MMTYKGYVGDARIDVEAGVFRGKVANIADTVTFQGKTVEEVGRAFRESVDDYLEFCASRNEAPDKPFSGRIPLRVKPRVHRALSTAAKLSDQSLNAYIARRLTNFARRLEVQLGLESNPAEAASNAKSGSKVASRPRAKG